MLLAVLGSFAALICSMRIPFSAGRARLTWTLLGAVSLGGGAVWSMHFIGMIGYRVDDRDLRYDLPLTGVSLLIAVGVSAVGLSLVARRPGSLVRLVAAGVVAGLGVAAMHYTGMAAMHVGSDITYERRLVVVSVLIAIGAALAALWIAFRVVTGWHVALASVVMAVAVCGMHYTAMAATQVAATATPQPTSGADPITLALLVCVLAFSVLAVVIFAALGGVTYDDAFSQVRENRHRRSAPPQPPAGASHADRENTIFAGRQAGQAMTAGRPMTAWQSGGAGSAGQAAVPPGQPGSGRDEEWPGSGEWPVQRTPADAYGEESAWSDETGAPPRRS